jgi:predicted dehydrogenase
MRGEELMNLSRRTTVAGAAVLTGAGFLPKRVFGANERINVAFVGAGGKGNHAVKMLTGNPMVNFVAFADVDEARAVPSYQQYPGLPRYRDFRAMLDKHEKQIDAVVVSTPDHTHHYAAKWCMVRSKHVYVEKPLAHSIREVRDLMAAEKKYKLACQMGNQGHSGVGLQTLRLWMEEGVLGDVREVRAWSNSGWNKADLARPTGDPVPGTLDWDQWIGPAAKVDYSSAYLPAKWRGWNEFGSGALGDWACHNMDAAYDVLELDCPSSVKLESTGPSKLSFPASVRLTYTFPATKERGEVILKWYQGKEYSPERPADMDPERQMGTDGGGTLLIGSKATVVMGSHAGTPRIVPETKQRELAKSLPKVREKQSKHYDNWLLGIKGEETCRSNFAYGGRLTETMMYGLIAMKLNRDLTIDPNKRLIVGDKEALEAMRGPAPREKWGIFG